MSVNRDWTYKAALDAIEAVLDSSAMTTELAAHNSAQTWTLAKPVEFRRRTLVEQPLLRTPVCAMYVIESAHPPSVLRVYDVRAQVHLEFVLSLADILAAPGSDPSIIHDALSVYQQAAVAVLGQELLNLSGTLRSAGVWSVRAVSTHHDPVIVSDASASQWVGWSKIVIEIRQRQPQETSGASSRSSFRVWPSATFDAAAGGSEVTAGDYQDVADTGRLYLYNAGTWILVGSADGSALTVAGIGTWSDPGDSIATGVRVNDSADGNAPYEWDGAAWAAIGGGGDLGDFNGYIEATYDGASAPATNDQLITLDTFRVYRRTAGGDLDLEGSAADGHLTIAGIGTWSDAGDGITDGTLIEDTTAGIIYEAASDAWVRLAPTLAQEEVSRITGARIAELITDGTATVHVGAAYLSTSGTALRAMLDGTSAEQRIVVSLPIATPTDEIIAGGRLSLVSGGGAGVGWESCVGWIADDGTLDLSTANLIAQGSGLSVTTVRRMGGMGRDATNMRRIAESGAGSTIATNGILTSTRAIHPTVVDASGNLYGSARVTGFDSGGAVTAETAISPHASTTPSTPRFRWVWVARCRSGGAVTIDLLTARMGAS